MLRTRHKTYLQQDDDTRRCAQVAASSPRAILAFLVRLLFAKMQWKMAGQREEQKRFSALPGRRTNLAC